MKRHCLTGFLALVWVAALLVLAARPAQGQVAWQASGGPIVNRILMLAPREYQQQLRQAEEAIEHEQYSEAIQALAQLLDSNTHGPDGRPDEVQEDFFIGRPGDAHLTASLRSEAQRLLGKLPARGQELYRLNFGAQAQRLLDQALSEHDDELLGEVAWRFFHTDAGYMASLLLGTHHLDCGRPLAAALCLARLSEVADAQARFDPELSVLLASSWQQAGQPERAREVLRQLRERLPRASLTLGGQRVPLFAAAEDPLDWLTRHLPASAVPATPLSFAWQMHRGLPSRNPTTSGGMPLLRHRWKVPLANTPDDEELIQSLLAERREQAAAPMASVTPLVIDGVVLLRTPDNLLAVDFETGKRIWEYPWADPPEPLLSDAEAPARSRPQRRQQLEERLWMDAAYGQLSSDGKCVFLLDQLNYIGPGAMDPAMQMFRNVGMPDTDQSKEYNSLLALELRTQGKFRWRVGGVTGEDEPALARAFFLGPPLVLADALYVLAEVRGDISLFVLDAATGRLRWSQQLAHVGPLNIVQDVTRRLAGATPSYSDGVLVCPTSAGGIVAVDILSRSLLWGYQYPRSFAIFSGGMRLNFVQTRRQLQQAGDGRWLDAAPLIGQGHVVVTPAESDELICLDLLTGKHQWSVPRQDDLLLTACLYRGQAIVLGNSKVVAYDLDKGTQRWELPIDDGSHSTAPSERPAGRGFLSDHRYYLPTTARLLVIDLERGQLDSALEMNETLGNLVPYGDQVVSLSADALTTFYQTERLEQIIQQRLAAAPHDPWAMEHRGLLQLERGSRLAALQSLRDAYRGYPENDDRREATRVVLVETLLLSLEEDDGASDELIGEVDALIDRPLQRERYLRLIGQRTLRNGKPLEAFKSFLELARWQDTPAGLGVYEDPSLPLIEARGRSHLIRRDRYVRSGLREAWRLADEQQRRVMEQQVLEQRTAALAENRVNRLQDFLRIFADHALADPIRLELARRFLEVGELLQVEQLVSPLLERQPSHEVGEAWLLMARTMQLAGDSELLAQSLEQLETNWSSEALDQGKTGVEWAAELRGGGGIAAEPRGIAAWPYGRVQIERLRGSASNLPTGFQAYSNYRPVRLCGSTGALPARLQIAYDATGTNSIVINDSLGRERVRVPGTNGRIKRFVDGTLTAKTLGHLVLVNFGHGVLAANALQGGQPDDQHVLWPKEYTELLDEVDSRTTRMQSVSQRNAWGQQQVDVSGRRVHAIGPTEFDGVVYLQGNSLYCVDPLRGQSLWVRNDVAAGARVWGDAEVVLVAAEDGPTPGKARVFNFLDGEELPSRPVPPSERIWSTVGRAVLTWDEVKTNNQAIWRLRLFDPATGQDVWQRDYPAESRGELTADGELAIVTPAHRLEVLDASSGAVRIEHELEKISDRPLLSVMWRSSADQSLLIRAFEPRATAGTSIESFPDEVTCPLIDGDVYAFQRPSGKPQWQVSAVIEGYGLPVDQPSGVPVLAFVRQISRAGNRSRRPTLSLLCIDKRDGRLLLEEDNLNFSYGSFFMSGDPQQHTVSLRLLNVHNFQLTFTDEPQPPEPPAQTGSAASQGNDGGFLKVLGAIFGRRSGEDDDGSEDAQPAPGGQQQPVDRDPFQPRP